MNPPKCNLLNNFTECLPMTWQSLISYSKYQYKNPNNQSGIFLSNPVSISSAAIINDSAFFNCFDVFDFPYVLHQ